MFNKKRWLRELDEETLNLWKANTKLRKRVYLLENHTKHVETKLSVLRRCGEVQVLINSQLRGRIKKLEDRVAKLEPKPKKEAKKK